MDNNDLSYIAGFFDGEGCITAFIRGDEYKGHAYSRCQISIVNTNKELLEWISTIIGGKVYCHSHKEAPNRKPCFTLHVPPVSSYFALLTLVDLLKDKKEQAEVALEFLAFKFTNCNHPNHDIDNYYVSKLKNLKKKTWGEAHGDGSKLEEIK